jgi:hypothetical protein
VAYVSILFTGANYPGGQTYCALDFIPGTRKAKVVTVQRVMDNVSSPHFSLGGASVLFASEVQVNGYLNQLDTSDRSNEMFLAVLDIG